MEKCFVDKMRYMTRGIAEHLPISLQTHLWGYIEDLANIMEADYLQVFRLKKDGSKLTIIHSQEVPEYEKKHELIVDDSMEIYEETIFVIDDGPYATMLWASEY